MTIDNRRNFLRTSALAGATAAMGNVPDARADQPKRRNTDTGELPNVLIIMTDQHRPDLMTCAGRDLVPTPNIDRIAERGVRFTNAYCPYPVCVASRMALLSGLYAHSTGAIDNTGRLDWRLRTMANDFAENGYLTGLVGKMHFNDSHKHGFEFYTSINDWLMYLGPKVHHYANEIANHPLNDYFYRTVNDSGAGLPDLEGVWDGPSPWVGNVERWDFSSMASPLEAEDHLDMFIARESAKFLRRYKGQRFFMITSFMKPHSPFYPPKEYADKYPIDSLELPPLGDSTQYPEHTQRRIRNTQRIGDRRLKAHRAGYLGNLAFADTCVGYVYRELEELGLLDNTIVIYTSDHGEMDGDHGLYQKFCLFEPSVGIPLIVSWPNHIPQNKVSNALVEYIGIYPTLLDLAGLEQPGSTQLIDIPNGPDTMDAWSFAPFVQNPDLPGPDAVFSEYALKSAIPQYMVRTKSHKYVYNHGSRSELYDCDSDPGETRNRIDDPSGKKIHNEMHERLVAWYNPETNHYRKKG